MGAISNKTFEQRLRACLQWFTPDQTGFAVLTLLFLSLLFTYPTIVQLSTHLIGGTADGWQFPWNNFIFRERVLDGKDPYFTDYVFYPAGVSLVLHGYTEFNDVLGILLSPFLNDVAVTNLMVILATFLSGMGMYLLAKDLTKSPVAALFAAIAFAFCPFRMIRIIGHIHMALTQFLPFAIWAFLKMGETRKLRYSFWTGLFFALACYCNYYYVVYLTLAFLFMLFYGWIRYPHWRTMLFLRSLILSGLWAVFFLLPVLFHVYTLVHTSTAGSYVGREEFFIKQSATLGQYLRISPLNTSIQNLLGESPFISPYSKITPGWTVLFLSFGGIVYAVRNRPRYSGILLFMGFGFFLLSLGPFFEIMDQIRLPLPYLLVMKIPFVNHVRIPERFAIMVNLAMAIAAAYFLKEILMRLSRNSRKVLAAGIFALLLFELASFPYPMEAFDPPKIFYKLAQSEGKTMLSLPFYPGDIRAKNYMRYQLIHKKKLLDGRVSRNPWPPIHYVENIPIAKSFRSATMKGGRLQNEEEDRKVAALFRQFFNVRYLTLYPPYGYRPEVRSYVQEVFPDAQLLSEEKNILVYELPGMESHSFRFTKKDPEILYFLFENWKVDRKGYRIVCYEDQAKLLFPDVRSGQKLIVKLVMRNRQPEISAVTLRIGHHLISQGSLGSRLAPWKMEIPGNVLIRNGRIAQLDFQKRQADSAVELQSIELEIVSAQ